MHIGHASPSSFKHNRTHEGHLTSGSSIFHSIHQSCLETCCKNLKNRLVILWSVAIRTLPLSLMNLLTPAHHPGTWKPGLEQLSYDSTGKLQSLQLGRDNIIFLEQTKSKYETLQTVRAFFVQDLYIWVI